MAKKKPAKPAAKTSAKIKKTAQPRSNVKILERQKSQGLTPQARANANKIMNAQRTADTNAAKSGEKAKRLADLMEQGNKGKSKKVIKIRSGGAGLGGMFGTKNR